MKTPTTRYKENRLQQLRGFCYTAEFGSISRAAERLLLRQPSVSMQIQALEREFNTTLFERRGPRITLTPAGRILYELASPLVEGLDSLRESFDARRDVIAGGRLDIAAGESTILYILPPFVKTFAEHYPNVELKLHNVTGRDGLEMLRAGEVDFAAGSMMDLPNDIEYRPIFTYDPILITVRGHPLAKQQEITMEDLARHPLILPPRHLTTWRVVDLVFKQHNLSYQVRLEAGGWEVIKKYVEMGLGVSIVTGICLTGRENLETIPVNRYFPQRTYGIVLRKGKFLSPQARRFIEMLDASVAGRGVESDGGRGGEKVRK